MRKRCHQAGRVLWGLCTGQECAWGWGVRGTCRATLCATGTGAEHPTQVGYLSSLSTFSVLKMWGAEGLNWKHMGRDRTQRHGEHVPQEL